MANVDRDLEELMSQLGPFGKYQFRQFCLHIIGALTAGLHMLTLLTVAAVPPHRCALPTVNSTSMLDDPFGVNSSFPADFSTVAVPTTTTTANASTTFRNLPRPLDACHYLDEFNVTRDCESWVYCTEYFKSSRGMEWNFVCSRRWMGAMAQSSYMFGVFVGAVTLGTLADKYGRKVIFYVSAIAQLILGTFVAFINNYYFFLVIRFLYGIFGSAGAYITGFVLTMELVGASKRTVCGIMFQLAFAMGFMLVAIWGAIIKDRMWLQIVYGLHSALMIGHWWLMDESPRWLWAQGRIKEATDILQKALKMNGKEVQVDAAKLLTKRAQEENEEDSKGRNVQERQREKKNRASALDLLKTPNLRKKTLNVCLNWFANSIVYYGLSLNSGNLVGNPYLMLFLSALVEFPSYILLCFVMDKTGRRSLVSFFMLAGGLCCIIATFIPKTTGTSFVAIAAVVLLGKACMAASFAVIYNYTAELFPTVVRNTALGIGSMCARLSGALTPLIMLLDSLNPKVPAALFGLVALISGFLSLYLPETVNQPMPETIEDGEEFGKGDTFFASCLARKKSKHHGNADASLEDARDKSEKQKLNET